MEAQTTRRRMTAVDRRQAIIDAARDAFAEGGFHQTALDEVADRAGVSKALIYEHFASKRELHAAMLSQHVEELIERINAAVMAAEPGEDRLRRGLEAFLGFVEERRGTWRIMFRNPSDPDVIENLERLRAQVATAIVALMHEEAEARDLPELGDAEIEMLAMQMIGGLQSLADWWEEHPQTARRQVMDVAMSSLWLGHERLSQGERWES